MEKEKKKQESLLLVWKDRLGASDTAYASESALMDDRERLYKGNRDLKPLVDGDEGKEKKTRHVRNIVFENVETQISSSIPQPKVTPKRQKDEHLANIIEHFLRNELDRLPFEEMNDMAERTVPIQGGVGFLVEWDSSKGDGELAVSVIHPKQFGPQPGVYTGVDDMDWFILKQPSTKAAVRRRYGKSVYAEGEAEPELRGTGSEDHSDEAVTVYIGYERSDTGTINKFTWVNDVVLEALEDYQARHQPVCKACGEVKPVDGDGAEGDRCPHCGGSYMDKPQEKETILQLGQTQVDEMGNSIAVMKQVEVPLYKPDCMPIVIQRSVSVFGQLLGNSDVDMIADQQNTTNRLEKKIIDRLLTAGSRVTLPKRMDMDPDDGKPWFLNDPAEKALIDVYEFKGNLQYELAFLGQSYEESRQILGITDSFQGRRDPTATSGVAKERSAAQAAGRMESKRVMKNAAYARLFEVMFKFALAYSDVPKEVSFKNHQGKTEYQLFNRYDFLEPDGQGGYIWNDQFLFSCDTSAPLASNREAMWQETRMNLQTGAFGDPKATETLILFWDKMEQLHYPGAASTKQYLEDRLEKEQQRAMMAGPSAAPVPAGGASEAMNMASIAMGG